MPKTERKLIFVPDEDPETPYNNIPEPARFEEGGADFVRAKDIEAIATMLIDHYEGEFAHLRKMAISYAWKRAGGKHSGAPKLGKCVKASGLTRFFSDCDFVLWLAADHLREFNDGEPATYWQIEALVFHELLHAQVDDNGAPALRAHDFEGFAKDVTEYGAWDEAGEIMRVAFKQLSLQI